MLWIDLFIALVIILIILMTLSFVGQIWMQVPWIPTPKPVLHLALKESSINKGDTVLDLGAGDARFLIEAKRAQPSITAIGYELSPLVWVLGKLRIWLSGQDVTLYYKNAFKADLTSADVVFVYLFPHLMKKLEPLCKRQLRKGARVISFAFAFPTKKPKKMPSLDFWKKGRRLYIYQF